MIVAVDVISCLVSSWIMSHLGRNPVSGGSPAKDRSVSIKIAFSDGIFVHAVIIEDSFRVLVVLRVRKMAVVIMQYR